MAPFSQHFISSLRKTKNITQVFKVNVSAINMVVFGMVILFAFMYIVQVNHTTTKGYHIRDLEVRISELERTNKKFELLAQEAGSMDRVSRSVKMLGMVKSDIPQFVTGGTASVVVNR